MELFDGDDANLLHIAQHDVTADAAEHVLTNNPLDLDTPLLESEERLAQVGVTRQGRILVVISKVRGECVRIVTSFDASRRDKLLFERWRGGKNATKT